MGVLLLLLCATNDFEFESDRFVDVVYSAVLWRVLSCFISAMV